MLKRIGEKESLIEKTEPRKDWASSVPFDKVKKKILAALGYKPHEMTKNVISPGLQLNKYGACFSFVYKCASLQQTLKKLKKKLFYKINSKNLFAIINSVTDFCTIIDLKTGRTWTLLSYLKEKKYLKKTDLKFRKNDVRICR